MTEQNILALTTAAPVDAAFVLSLVLGGRPEGTQRSYNGTFRDFTKFAITLGGVPAVETEPLTALRSLIALERGQANAILSSYRIDMLTRKLSAATVNNRMAALRTFVREAKRCGLVEWTCDVDNVASKQLRDTAGPSHTGYRAMLEQAAARSDAKGARDYAMLRLLYDTGLRRKEVAGLDYEDYDPIREWGDGQKGGLRIIQKRDSEHTWIGLPSSVQRALEAWLVCRGHEPGPLFQNLDEHAQNVKDGRRLSKGAFWKIVSKYGRKAGLVKPISPHRLRHGGATRAARVTNGNAVAVQAFGRWKSLQTAQVYILADKALGSQVAALVAAED